MEVMLSTLRSRNGTRFVIETTSASVENEDANYNYLLS